MGHARRVWLVLLTLLTALGLTGSPVAAQQKPNILFIMGDDIG
jgi:hypothetical protein